MKKTTKGVQSKLRRRMLRAMCRMVNSESLFFKRYLRNLYSKICRLEMRVLRISTRSISRPQDILIQERLKDVTSKFWWETKNLFVIKQFSSLDQPTLTNLSNIRQRKKQEEGKNLTSSTSTCPTGCLQSPSNTM